MSNKFAVQEQNSNRAISVYSGFNRFYKTVVEQDFHNKFPSTFGVIYQLLVSGEYYDIQSEKIAKLTTSFDKILYFFMSEMDDYVDLLKEKDKKKYENLTDYFFLLSGIIRRVAVNNREVGDIREKIFYVVYFYQYLEKNYPEIFSEDDIVKSISEEINKTNSRVKDTVEKTEPKSRFDRIKGLFGFKGKGSEKAVIEADPNLNTELLQKVAMQMKEMKRKEEELKLENEKAQAERERLMADKQRQEEEIKRMKMEREKDKEELKEQGIKSKIQSKIAKSHMNIGQYTNLLLNPDLSLSQKLLHIQETYLLLMQDRKELLEYFLEVSKLSVDDYHRNPKIQENFSNLPFLRVLEPFLDSFQLLKEIVDAKANQNKLNQIQSRIVVMGKNNSTNHQLLTVLRILDQNINAQLINQAA